MKRILQVAIASFLILICFASPVPAQEAEQPLISTDRPTVGSSPDLIPSHSLQIENGVNATFQRDQFIGDFPESLVRFGITQRIEARFIFGDEVYRRSNTPNLASLQTLDPSFGFKIGLGKPTTIYPRSVLASLSLPRGGPSWTSGSYDPGLTFIWTQAFKRGYFLNELAGGGTLTTLAGARRMGWTPSVAGGQALSHALTGFAEYAPTVFAYGSTAYIVDGGFATVIRKLSQFDVRARYLCDQTGHHTLLSIGYSIRRDGLFRAPHYLF